MVRPHFSLNIALSLSLCLPDDYGSYYRVESLQSTPSRLIFQPQRRNDSLTTLSNGQYTTHETSIASDDFVTVTLAQIQSELLINRGGSQRTKISMRQNRSVSLVSDHGSVDITKSYLADYPPRARVVSPKSVEMENKENVKNAF